MPEAVCEEAGQAARNALKEAQDVKDKVDDAREALYDAIDALDSATSDVTILCTAALFSPMFGPEGIVAGGGACNLAVVKMEKQFDVMERKAANLDKREKQLDQAIADAGKALDGFKHCLEDAAEDDDGIVIFDEDEDQG